jgi:hypothetical protein
MNSNGLPVCIRRCLALAQLATQNSQIEPCDMGHRLNRLFQPVFVQNSGKVWPPSRLQAIGLLQKLSQADIWNRQEGRRGCCRFRFFCAHGDHISDKNPRWPTLGRMPNFCQKDGIRQSECNFQAMRLTPIKKA